MLLEKKTRTDLLIGTSGFGCFSKSKTLPTIGIDLQNLNENLSVVVKIFLGEKMLQKMRF